MSRSSQFDDKVPAQDRLARYYYNESFLTNWLTVAMTLLVLGTTLKLDVHTVIGATTFLFGILLLGWTLAMAVVWMATGESNVSLTIRIRRWALIPVVVLLAGLLGLVIWAVALLFADKGTNIQ
jgi:hypothetical protein